MSWDVCVLVWDLGVKTNRIFLNETRYEAVAVNGKRDTHSSALTSACLVLCRSASGVVLGVGAKATIRRDRNKRRGRIDDARQHVHCTESAGLGCSQDNTSRVVLAFPPPASPPCVVGSITAAVVHLVHRIHRVVCPQHLPTYIYKHFIDVCCASSSAPLLRGPPPTTHQVQPSSRFLISTKRGETHSSSERSLRSRERPIVVRWKRLSSEVLPAGPRGRPCSL